MRALLRNIINYTTYKGTGDLFVFVLSVCPRLKSLNRFVFPHRRARVALDLGLASLTLDKTLCMNSKLSNRVYVSKSLLFSLCLFSKLFT